MFIFNNKCITSLITYYFYLYLQKILSGAEAQGQGANESSQVMSEMTIGIQQVAEATSSASEEQLASMEEIATSTSALSKMAEDLQNHVNKFKVS